MLLSWLGQWKEGDWLEEKGSKPVSQFQNIPPKIGNPSFFWQEGPIDGAEARGRGTAPTRFRAGSEASSRGTTQVHPQGMLHRFIRAHA